MVNTILKEADLFCPNSVRINFTIYQPTANNRFIDDIESTYQKILGLRFGRRSKDGLHREFFVMFTEFEINGNADDPYVDIKIYPKAIKLLNELESWVRYALSEFRDLKSSYAKTMFRLLKQFRTTGYAYFSVADFNELLDVPKSYKSSNINQSVLKPIKEELTPLFRGLTVRKKHGKGRGKPVIGYLPGSLKRKTLMTSHRVNFKMNVKNYLTFRIMVN